jgi:uncharacterized protein with FMN-binding domain
MRRAPIVLTATVAGVAGVLSFHAHPQPLAVVAASPPSSSAGSTRSTTQVTSGSSTAPTSATGAVSQNQYGSVQVKVTVAGGKIKQVTAVQLPQGDPKSAQISQYAAPQLQSEALAAQSAQIDGVSGASYTSQSYATSLQSALDAVHFKQ